MPTKISREDVLRLMEEGAQIVEVLPFKEYEEEHLPGAINLSLKELDQKAKAHLDKQRLVIIYCHDLQ